MLKDKLALVVPTLNEAECLPFILEETRRVLDGVHIPYEILVVDDESSDGTAEIVARIAAADPRVRLLVRQGERGLAGAVLHGWQHTDAEILGVMDADMQHPPALLPKLLTAMTGGADVALASRYVDDVPRQGWNALRRVVSTSSIWLARPLQSPAKRVKDPLSGFFLVRRRCVARFAFRPTGFKLLLEILIRGRVRRVVEVPFQFGQRGAGRSKAGLGVAWDYLVLLASLYLARWKAMGILARTSD